MAFQKKQKDQEESFKRMEGERKRQRDQEVQCERMEEDGEVERSNNEPYLLHFNQE